MEMEIKFHKKGAGYKNVIIYTNEKRKFLDSYEYITNFSAGSYSPVRPMSLSDALIEYEDLKNHYDEIEDKYDYKCYQSIIEELKTYGSDTDNIFLIPLHADSSILDYKVIRSDCLENAIEEHLVKNYEFDYKVIWQ